jgi:hypothetical protein
MIAMAPLLQLLECNTTGIAYFQAQQHSLAARIFRRAINLLHAAMRECPLEKSLDVVGQADNIGGMDDDESDGSILLSCEPYEVSTQEDLRASGYYMFRRPFSVSIASANTDKPEASHISTPDTDRVGAVLLFNLALAYHCQDGTSEKASSLYHMVGSLHKEVDLLSVAAVNNSAVWYLENAEFGLARDQFSMLQTLLHSNDSLLQRHERLVMFANLTFLFLSSFASPAA